MTNNELNSIADFNPAKHHSDAGFRNPEPVHDAEKSDVVFLSMAQAAKMTGYHQDYLGQMARSGKLEAIKVGRNWQTTKLAIDKMLGRVPKEEVAPAPVQAPVQKVEAPKISAPMEVAKISAPAPVQVPTPEPVKPVAIETPKPIVTEPVKVVATETPKPVSVQPKILTPQVVAPVASQPVKLVVVQPQIQKVSEPAKVTSQISTQPVSAPVQISKPVAVNIPKPQPVAVSVAKPQPVVEKIETKISAPQPVKVFSQVPKPAPVAQPTVESKPQQVFSKISAQPKKVNIKHLITSEAAGPNLQELIATHVQEDVVQYTNIDVQNREKLLRWNKMAPSYPRQRNNFTSQRFTEFTQHHPEVEEEIEEPVRSRSSWKYAVAGIATIMLAAAGYLGSTYLNATPTDNALNVFAEPERMVAGESTSITEPTTGKVTVPVGATEFIVKDENVTVSSTILITFRDDYEGRYWVSGQGEGEFTVKFSQAMTAKTTFDYMVIAEEGANP